MLPSLDPTDLSRACNVLTYSPASSGDLFADDEWQKEWGDIRTRRGKHQAVRLASCQDLTRSP